MTAPTRTDSLRRSLFCSPAASEGQGLPDDGLVVSTPEPWPSRFRRAGNYLQSLGGGGVSPLRRWTHKHGMDNVGNLTKELAARGSMARVLATFDRVGLETRWSFASSSGTASDLLLRRKKTNTKTRGTRRTHPLLMEQAKASERKRENERATAHDPSSGSNATPNARASGS